ncbi:hypothetical protein ACVIIV_000889 [Bradyrhizobium sp. USDA 4354]
MCDGMAGCCPDYMPDVLTALEAALDPLFTIHGLLCTTCFSSPIIIVNGPVAREIGMNFGIKQQIYGFTGAGARRLER